MAENLAIEPTRAKRPVIFGHWKGRKAVELLPLLEAEAKKKQTDVKIGNQNASKSNSQKIEQLISKDNLFSSEQKLGMTYEQEQIERQNDVVIDANVLSNIVKKLDSSPALEKIKQNTAAINEKKSTEKAAGFEEQFIQLKECHALIKSGIPLPTPTHQANIADAKIQSIT